jgi:hypothetical protein
MLLAASTFNSLTNADAVKTLPTRATNIGIVGA